MKMGSAPVTESSGSSTNSFTESTLAGGLKFGKKIYFEDVSGGVPAPGASSSSGSGRRGRGGGIGQGGQPPRCQVEGCRVDLSNAKAYYSRHKVCGMHSKSPTVIVAGLEQRFCQQCSRFHRLPEFDQGKRSCRRRLAGHNERRRKPQPGSLLTSRYARLSSSIFGTSGMGGSFVMDPMAWPMARSSEHLTGTHMRRSLATPWQINSENPPLEIFQQGSIGGGTSFSCPGITSSGVESFKGVADSSCALSLLSNQQQQLPPTSQPPPWWSSARVSTSFNLMDAEEVSVAQPGFSHHYPNPSWGFKGSDRGIGSHDIAPVLGLGQISDPASSGIPADGGSLFELPRHRRQFPQEEDSRAYESSSSAQHHNWSL